MLRLVAQKVQFEDLSTDRLTLHFELMEKMPELEGIDPSGSRILLQTGELYSARTREAKAVFTDMYAAISRNPEIIKSRVASCYRKKIKAGIMISEDNHLFMAQYWKSGKDGLSPLFCRKDAWKTRKQLDSSGYFSRGI